MIFQSKLNIFSRLQITNCGIKTEKTNASCHNIGINLQLVYQIMRLETTKNFPLRHMNIFHNLDITNNQY